MILQRCGRQRYGVVAPYLPNANLADRSTALWLTDLLPFFLFIFIQCPAYMSEGLFPSADGLPPTLWSQERAPGEGGETGRIGRSSGKSRRLQGSDHVM